LLHIYLQRLVGKRRIVVRIALRSNSKLSVSIPVRVLGVLELDC